MKLKLFNFRCHVNKEIFIKDKGLTLLSGKNGQGKSTILEAIYFALYGDVKKPYTFGTNTCKVELQFHQFKITRTCRPNRLLVEFLDNSDTNIYEDDEAQHVINNNLMNMYEFLASSYIRQKSNSSILTMTPAEQVQFIKNIAYDTDSNVKIKNIIKEMLKETHDDITRSKNNLDVYSKQLKELEKSGQSFGTEEDVKNIVNPLDVSEEEFLRIVELTTKKLRDMKEFRTVKQDELSDYENGLTKNKEVIERITNLSFEINQLMDKISEFGKVVKDEHLEKLEASLEPLRNKRELLLKQDYYIEQELEFEDEVFEYYNDIEKKLDAIDNSINFTPQEYEELCKTQTDYVLYKDALTQIQNAVKSFREFFPNEKLYGKDEVEITDQIFKIVKDKCTLKTYRCPMCSTNLCIEGDKLVETSSTNRTSEYEMYDNILNIFNKNYELSKIHKEDNQAKIDDYLFKKRQIEEMELKLKQAKLPPFLQKKKDYLESIKMEEIEDDFYVVDNKIRNVEAYLEKQWKIKSDISNLENILQKKRKMHNDLTSSINAGENVNLNKEISEKRERLNKEIEAISRDIEETFAKQNEYNKKKMELVNYKAYMKYKESYEKLAGKVREANEQFLTFEQKYNCLLTLREKSNQAEILAVESIIENININAKYYLDMMFQTDPIIIRVENFKQTKDDIKFKMNTFIQFKGSEYENIDQLSGGERQKCELAFELAVNTLLNSKVLMLDECINNLDAEVNTEILQTLSKYAEDSNKLVIVVSHECVTGVFDNIYEL